MCTPKRLKYIRANKSDDNLKPPPAAICSTIPCSGQGKNLPSFRKVTSQHSQQLLSQEDPKAIVVFLFNFLLNKTIGDEGITVDFRFIKVHTSN